MTNTWLPIPSLPDYEVSEFGAVRRVTNGRTRRAGHEPKGHWVDGYLKYKLMNPDGTKGVYFAHRLVLLAFIGPPPTGKPFGLHNNGNSRLSHYTNLRWGSALDNQRDSAKHGTIRKGERNGRARLTKEQVLTARKRYAEARSKYGIVSGLARKFNVSKSAMRDAIHGRHWQIS